MMRKYRNRTVIFVCMLFGVLGAAFGILSFWRLEVKAATEQTGMEVDLEDGEYSITLDMEGGSGKASVSSPTLLTVKDGCAYATLTWSSSNYDYMIVNGVKYLNTAEEERNSTFEIPVLVMDGEMEVIADTLAMGTPHEITYTLLFYSDSIGSKGQLPQEGAKRVVVMALIIIVGGGVLNHFVQKRRNRL